MLHGFGEFWWSWRHQLASLTAAGYRAVAVDLRGYGDTDKPPRCYDGWTLAGDTHGLIRSLGHSRATLIGHADGGLVCWATAALHPRVVAQIAVLASPHPRALRRAVLRDRRQRDAFLGGHGERLKLGLAAPPVDGKANAALIAWAAKAFGVPFTLSTMSICSIEDIAEHTTAPFWFQLYMMRDRSAMKAMIERTRAAGCSALVLTLDLQVIGQRHKDLKNNMRATVIPSLGNLFDMATKPRWCLGMLGTQRHTFRNLVGHVKGVSDMKSLASWTNEQFDPSLSWADVAWVKEQWGGKLILKGIQDVEDARLAVASGADMLSVFDSEAIDLGVGSPQSAQDTARSATIIHVTATHLTVSVDTPFPTFPTGAVPSGFSWRIMRVKDDGTFSTGLPQALGGSAPFTDGQISYTATLEVSELSFWAVDAQVDDLTLYKTYGYFFTNPQLSTETYRSLIRGLMQLYILGPALARLESALNLTAGLPTIRSEGELLLAYDDGILYSGSTGNLLASDIFEAPSSIFTATSVGGFIKITNSDFANNVGTFNIIEYISGTQVRLRPGLPFTPDADVVWVNSQTNRQTVTTNANVYEYPLATPMRTDVVDPASVGVLTFRAFESVTTAIRVTDYVQDPEWWNNITIPQEIMPETPAARRVVTSQLYPNIVGPSGDAYVGDPGFYIGQDEEQQTVAYPQRHNAAFILMDRFLKLHMFAVIVDPSVSLTALLVTDLQKILKDVKPVHTALYFRPLTTFTDTVDITDYDVIVKPLRRQFEEITTLENDWLIGSAWNIGDTWKFTNLVGGVITINPGAGGIYVAVGGADPTIQPADPTNIPPGSLPDLSWLDRALYVYMH